MKTKNELLKLLHIPEYDDVSKPVTASLFEILHQFDDELNDDSTCYFGHAAEQFAAKKKANAEKAYAGHAVQSKNDESSLKGFVVLIDTTTFGKGDEGFYITETHLFFREKKAFSDEKIFSIKLNDISQIYVNEESIFINDNEIMFSVVSQNRMKIIADCISTYVSQKHNHENQKRLLIAA